MEARETKSFYSPKKIYQKGLCHIPKGSRLEFPLEVCFAIDGGAALAIHIAADGKGYVQTFRSFEGHACGDAHAVATIGVHGIANGDAGQVGELIAGATIVAQKLVVPSNVGVGLPLGAVIAIQCLGLGGQAIAQLGAQGVIGSAADFGADGATILVDAGTMGEAVIQGCEGTAFHDAVLLA